VKLGCVRGNCYVASEALYHLLGGHKQGWKSMTVRHEGEVHWFLKHKDGMTLDPTAVQFTSPPPYEKARGRGFLTRMPSDRARKLMDMIVWQREVR